MDCPTVPNVFSRAVVSKVTWGCCTIIGITGPGGPGGLGGPHPPGYLGCCALLGGPPSSGGPPPSGGPPLLGCPPLLSGGLPLLEYPLSQLFPPSGGLPLPSWYLLSGGLLSS